MLQLRSEGFSVGTLNYFFISIQFIQVTHESFGKESLKFDGQKVRQFYANK